MPVVTKLPPNSRFAIVSITDPYTVEEWLLLGLRSSLAISAANMGGFLSIDVGRRLRPRPSWKQ